jgi:hypothetical protein
MEYNQRFKERGLIEDRLGNYLEELRKQKQKEQRAKDEFENTRNALNEQREKILAAYNNINGRFDEVASEVNEIDNTLSIISELNRSAFDVGYEIAREQYLHMRRDDLPPQFRNQLDEIQEQLAAEMTMGESNVARKTSIFSNMFIFVTKLANYMKLLYDKNSKNSEEQVYINRYEKLKETLESLRVRIYRQRRSFPVAGLGEKFILNDNGFLVSESGNRGAVVRLEGEVRRNIAQIFKVRNLLNSFRFDPDHRKTLDQANLIADRLTNATSKDMTRLDVLNSLWLATYDFKLLAESVKSKSQEFDRSSRSLLLTLSAEDSPARPFSHWARLRDSIRGTFAGPLVQEIEPLIKRVDNGFQVLFETYVRYRSARENAALARQPLDAKKLLDGLLDEIEDKYIELLEGVRAHTANIDGYVKAVATALDDDFNTQFYYPAFQEVRKSSSYWDVQLGQVETTNILTNNRMFAKVEPQATMEFDLPKRDILINEAMNGAKALMDSYGALVADPSFLALTKLQSGQPTSSPAQGFGSGGNTVRNVLPGLPRSNDEQLLSQAPAGRREFGSPLEALIPDPAIYKFETGTGFEIRPVIQPDGQSVVFHLEYMYTTNVREPVRADEKHLGRVKRHFIDTEVQLGSSFQVLLY